MLLEVERGYRPPDVLRRYFAPHLMFDLESAQRPTGAPPVAAADVGGARFQRIGRRRGFGVVVIKEAAGHWAALMLALHRGDAGAWQVVEILRPTAAPPGTIGRSAAGWRGGPDARR
jgi:hypothetical protein